MGYELDRLIKQYGVGTATKQSYAGANMPTATTSPTYNQDLQRYQQDRQIYDQYLQNFQGRISQAPMYAQQQFNTNPQQSAGMQAATREGGIGADKYNQNIRDWMAKNQYASPAQVRAEQAKWGISNQDVMNATGNWYGNSLQGPTYGVAPATEDQAALVRQAYANVGRTGFGEGFSQIDRPGYDYWVNALKTGASTPEAFQRNFQTAIQDQLTNKPNDPYRQYVSDWLRKNDPNSPMLTPLPITQAPVYTPPVTETPTYYGGGGGGNFYETENVRPYKSGGRVRHVMRKYAIGGAVKGYQAGGVAEDEENGVQVFPIPPSEPRIQSTPLPPLPVEQAPAAVAPVAAPAVAPAAVAPAPAAPPLDARTAGLQTLLEKYGPQDSGYGAEVKAARARSDAETKAFTAMLERMMNTPEDAQSSKAEMYFRLAAAFGSPTRTGNFTENLGLAGKELADYAKGKRASAAEKRNLAIEVQKMKMGAAKEDLASVRALASEEMKDRRAIAQELIKDYIASGKPQSTAGKTAMDMGLQPGTPEYVAKVQELAEFDVQRQMAAINNQLANVTLAQANLALRQNQAQRLSPTEIKMKSEAEDLVASGKQALQDLSEAYRLNPNSLAGSWLEKGQQFLYEAAGSNDPTIVNTRVINNLLGAQGLAKLRATFGGNPTEGERNILLELEGIGSKTKEERAAIMRRAYRVLQDRVAREQRRLDDINSGAYRTTEPLPGEQ